MVVSAWQARHADSGCRLVMPISESFGDSFGGNIVAPPVKAAGLLRVPFANTAEEIIRNALALDDDAVIPAIISQSNPVAYQLAQLSVHDNQPLLAGEPVCRYCASGAYHFWLCMPPSYRPCT